MQESPPDSCVRPHTFGDLRHIGPARLTNRCNQVDIGNLQRQKAVGRMLNQFRAIQVGDDNRGFEWFVDRTHRRHGTLGSYPNDNSIRFLQVGHCTSLAKKLRITHHIEFDSFRPVSANRFRYLLPCFNWDGAFIDNDPISRQRLSDFTRHRFHIAQVNRSVILGRRGYSNKDHLRVRHRILSRSSEG